MGIRIQSLPANDPEFRDCVRAALRATSPHGDGTPDLAVASEQELRQALDAVRARYPEVWTRRQDPLASIDGVQTWYVFRDETLVLAEPVSGSRR
jgi:hypothetical protein